MSGVELIHNKFETKKHTLSIITADSIEYEGKRINFINPNLTSYNGDVTLIKLNAAKASPNSEMGMVHLDGGAAIKKVDSKGKTKLISNRKSCYSTCKIKSSQLTGQYR